MQSELFTSTEVESLGEGAVVLRGFVLPRETEIWEAVQNVTARAPFRHLITPGGFRMSVGMTNCGALGWVSDRKGYRYDPIDPESGLPWPAMPEAFQHLAADAAARAGFPAFEPEACLINRYDPGARLTLHQDKDEGNYDHPIASVSLGLPATFQWGGLTRAERPTRVPLHHGDVVVWGGPSRLHYHGVLPVKEGLHPLTGPCRINLTFRRAR